MRRLLIVLSLVAMVSGVGYTAEKNYQYTGTVKSVDKGTITVEKNAKEAPWTFTIDGSTKGTPKVGDKVTVYYKMIATEIEAKAATAKPDAAKKKK
jgi:hypothetical protein